MKYKRAVKKYLLRSAVTMGFFNEVHASRIFPIQPFVLIDENIPDLSGNRKTAGLYEYINMSEMAG